MKTTLFYFSATGNSLTTARLIAEQLGETELINVAGLRDRAKIVVESERVGFVYPVYYGNMPWPMRAAISKMVIPAESYIFSFTTYRGFAGTSAERLELLLRTRGVRLSCARGVAMPGNSFISDPEKARDQLEHQAENVAAALADIAAGLVEQVEPTAVHPSNPINFPNNFRGIEADENCIGCGTCARVCPMGNIRIEDGRAVIGDDCATCLACFHWCPKQAIWMSKQEDIARREKYRHPAVKLADILAGK